MHENHNENKTLFKLLCILDSKKRWDGKNLEKKIKEKYGVKKWSYKTTN